MDFLELRKNLCGCYVTVPTMFHGEGLELNLAAIAEHPTRDIQNRLYEAARGMPCVITG